MFASINEGLLAYRQAIRDYVVYADGIRKQYPVSAYLSLPRQPELEISMKSAALDGMAQALGLTKEEQGAIETECGIKKYPAKYPAG